MSDGSNVLGLPLRRTRTRGGQLSADQRQEIANRVVDLYETTLANRSTEEALRIQRYAKYRMWSEEKDWPWEGASNLPLPDMTEKSLRLQDTLHNAVMSQRPPIGAKALDKSDRDKERLIDRLIDFQVFVEQPGERIIGDLADQFVNDGHFTAFIPWVTEARPVSESRIFPAIPEDLIPEEYFSVLIDGIFPGAVQLSRSGGWDWDVTPQEDGAETIEISFYTRKTREVEMVTVVTATVYDGPKIVPYAWADVFHPPRAANLHRPGPSNKGGASFVILRDHGVTIDEIRRLGAGDDPFYDLMTPEDLERLEKQRADTTGQASEQVKDDLTGATTQESEVKGAESHRTLTRLTCFDLYDIDGDGLDEDMVWTVLLETKTLLRARRMTEIYPSSPPRRPLAEAALLPIEGRRGGMSLLEIMEGIHDATKAIFDQVIDGGTQKIAPPFFYRAAGGMKPEVIRMWPGEGYPLNDPRNDVYFPQLSNAADAMGLNTMSVLQGMGERLTTIGDLNLGRVPAGKSSALRTAAGISMIAGQGEARPERILRRFFMGLAEIWKQIHELDQRFLPKDKQFRIVGYSGEGHDLFGVIPEPGAISGRFAFDFTANVLNTSKNNLQQALGTLMQVYVTQIGIQLGITKPDGVYRLFRDVALAWGQDPDKYISEPTPDARFPRLFAEEAVSALIAGNIPEGRAAEAGGELEHFQKLIVFFQSKDFGYLPPENVELFKKYLMAAKARAIEEEQQKRLAIAAQQFAAESQGQSPGGAPPQQMPQNPQEQPMLSGGGELLDESLPGAGGGANTGMG